MLSRASLSGLPQISHCPLCCFLLSPHSLGCHLFYLKGGIFLLRVDAGLMVLYVSRACPSLMPSEHQAPGKETPKRCFCPLSSLFVLGDVLQNRASAELSLCPVVPTREEGLVRAWQPTGEGGLGPAVLRAAVSWLLAGSWLLLDGRGKCLLV